jgi:lysine-specific demethylase 8/hypoxia-inducible factor 1-alpha inhibitor (HIF hydroxylase)
MNSLTESNFSNSVQKNQVARVDASDLTAESFFEQYQKLGKPVIVTGLLKNGDWNLEYLCQNLGEQEFLLRYYGKTRYQYDKRHWKNIGSGVEGKKMEFNKYAELLRDRQAHEHDIYLAKCSIKNTTLDSENVLNSAAERLGLHKAISDFNIWISPGGHTECLHFDAVDGTLVQMHGAKKIVLFPPSQIYNLYPFPLSIHLRHGLKLRSWFSQVYPENPDFESFPKLKTALQHKHEVILNQGELLYIPAGWWHEVTALGNEMVCSVNRFWHISPTTRAIFSWSVWRTYLGNIFAIPYVLSSVIVALCSPDRQQKLKKIRQML